MGRSSQKPSLLTDVIALHTTCNAHRLPATEWRQAQCITYDGIRFVSGRLRP